MRLVKVVPHAFIPSHPRRAFTLIELLVVIAIIGILAAILFPVFGRARESARRSSCVSNLKQLGLAVEQYKQDYSRFLAPGQEIAICPRTRLEAYTKSNQIWVCPSEINTTTRNMTDARNVSYMFNRELASKQDADITRPAEIVITHDSDPAEGGWNEGNTWDAGLTTDWPHWRAVCDNSGTTGTKPEQPNCSRNSFKAAWFQRHNGTFAALFYDGHVKTIIASSSTLKDENFIP